MTEPRSSAWVSPPGDTIEDLLEERCWSKKELATRLGCTPKHVSELLKGQAPIHAEQAEQLARVLGSTTEFWLAREVQYRAALRRRDAAEHLAATEGALLQELPLRWMVQEGLVPDRQHPGDAVDAALRFFGVSSGAALRATYYDGGVAFRSSARFGRAPGAVATWLRRAELAAHGVRTAPFDEAGLRARLTGLRALTTEPHPDVFMPALTEACAAHGVAVVFVPAPPGCPASGCTRWMAPDRALLVLSLRHRTNDHLWFTFFHEVGHLLLHSKKAAFLEGLDGLDPALEAEADAFARHQLIPAAFDAELAGLRSAAAVQAFAAKVGVHPGIVVGRLQHDGRLPQTHLNKLKVRYTWSREAGDEG